MADLQGRDLRFSYEISETAGSRKWVHINVSDGDRIETIYSCGLNPDYSAGAEECAWRIVMAALARAFAEPEYDED